MDALLTKAAKGDESCLPKVKALLTDSEWGANAIDFCGSSAEWLRQSVARQASCGNVLAREAVRRKLDKVRAELEGPNPTPLERLLAERVSICWFVANWYEESFVNKDSLSLPLADFYQRRIDRAHRRFLSDVETLARVRKLALPFLQLNIARNQQVNMAGAGPTGGCL
jgi:hypothetical protein